MANELVVIERQLDTLRPMFEDLLQPIGVPAPRIIRSVLIACERVPRLLECTLPSVLQSSTSLAVLGLECDGVTGQGYLIPFRDHGVLKAQALVGVRGYNTLGERVGLALGSNIVREGDDFDFNEGTGAFIRHKRAPGSKDRRIIWAYAKAEAPSRSPRVRVMDLDEIYAIRDRSPGWKSGNQSPWRDPLFAPAMIEKTPKRRLARDLPLSVFQLAAALETMHEELGKYSFLHPQKGVVIDHPVAPLGGTEETPGPSAAALDKPRFVIKGVRGDSVLDSIEQWRAEIIRVIGGITSMDNVEKFRDLNNHNMDLYGEQHREHVAAVAAAFEKRLRGERL